MALDTYALTTVAAAKSHLGILAGDTSQDAVLERFINSASARIENYINRKVLKRAYTEYQDGRGNDRILLRQWPADKPTELWDDVDNEFTDPNNQFDAPDFVLEETSDGGIGVVLVDGQRFNRGNQNIKIVYEAGYSTVPYDLQDACLFIVDYLYAIKQDRRVGVSSKSKNGESVQFLENLPEHITDILDRYARCEFALVSAPVGNGQ